MNDIERWFSWPVNPASFTPVVFPVLHAWLRSLELCLNIIERLDIADTYQPYQPYTQAQKDLMKARKNEATDQLRNGIGILVGKTVSSQVGTGSSNNGNTARRFFEDPALTAELTGLDEEFLEHLRVVLIVVSSGFAIDVESFRNYTQETARLYVTHYNWYWMTASVHTLLVHGPDFVKVAPVPLGLLSEEALEACHKRVRHIRKHHVQLWNRAAGMKDLIHGLLIASDPVTNTLRTPPKRKHLRFGTTVLSLLTDKDADPEDQACDAFDEASH
ncbi:hypothetical protein FOCC_FOCC014944 [Frankliniella occidentalis]|nr:hypothetical protein FOCC_FOCC014944 [Frankliniella occidentalis]